MKKSLCGEKRRRLAMLRSNHQNIPLDSFFLPCPSIGDRTISRSYKTGGGKPATGDRRWPMPVASPKASSGDLMMLIAPSLRLRLPERRRSVALLMRPERLPSPRLRPRLCPFGSGGASTGTMPSLGATTMGSSVSSSSMTISIMPEATVPATGGCRRTCGNGGGGGGGGTARCCSSLRKVRGAEGGGGGGGGTRSLLCRRHSVSTISSRPLPSLALPFLMKRGCRDGSSGIGADMLRGIIGRVGGW